MTTIEVDKNTSQVETFLIPHQTLSTTNVEYDMNGTNVMNGTILMVFVLKMLSLQMLLLHH